MLEEEIRELIEKVRRQQCESQCVEVKSAAKGCPERLYDTFSAFANQDEGGVILFGLDESQGFAKVGVYDAKNLQTRLAEAGEEMTPIVRPVVSIYEEEGKQFVVAEIPPLDVSERPCFKTARGRLKGAFIRVGEADKPMSEYEVYSYEAYRRQTHDELRPLPDVTEALIDETLVEAYLALRQQGRTNFAAAMTREQLWSTMGLLREGKFTMLALLLFGCYPQATFPQLGIVACRVAGEAMGGLGENGERFLDSVRIEGRLPEMLEGALAFAKRNMRTAIHVSPQTGTREDRDEYPLDALRESILNALVHRDYSVYTENQPICLTFFSNRVEIQNPGGLYGRLTLDQLGKTQPDTRNPALVVAMEALGQTENRYSGIPRIRRAMAEAGLPEPCFDDTRECFRVTLYNRVLEPGLGAESGKKHEARSEAALLAFCATPRTKQEIAAFLGIASIGYALRRYVSPLVEKGVLVMAFPETPRSRKQRYQARSAVDGDRALQ